MKELGMFMSQGPWGCLPTIPAWKTGPTQGLDHSANATDSKAEKLWDSEAVSLAEAKHAKARQGHP